MSIFLSYSHHDAEMLTELKKHLAGLRRTNKIKTWHDRDIEAGDEWEPAIKHQLNTADIIILLISADFIASDYCYCNELQRAIERHDAGEACVIPVILRPCLWNDSDIPFSKLNVLPDRALAITKWKDAAEAYTNVAEGISSTVEGLKDRKLKKLEAVDLASDASNNQLLASIPSNSVPIEQLRERSRQKILERHSRMRLLSGDEIGVDQLYVDVWLLGKPEHKHFSTLESLFSNFDIVQDRLALSKRIQRNPGFEIATSQPKLVILGKPGSGKTTFLKHLAVDWCKGKFQPEQIAVLIELRRIREKDKSQEWTLVDVISQELELEKNAVLDLLKKGKLLLLMDGLDEVSTNEFRRKVQGQVEQVAKQYSNKNRFILTCRTQILGVIPNSFASVEVADFNSGQIKKFVQNWFTANEKLNIEAAQQWELMRLAISSQPDLGEVTATPVLLSLICVVWQDSGEIPTNKTSLYKRAVSWLLRRWNDEKKIEDWEFGTETYRKLSIKDKETLLTEIAARKFENPKNFVLFEQDELVEQISRKLRLSNAQEGLAVLRAIEAQHGLLIERADELWSFSHLTFQEYFTVQWLTQLPSQQLAEKIANQQWQIAVAQLVKSQQPADRLLRLIKQAIDQLIAQDSLIQPFLGWVVQKSSSLQSHYRSVAIRALYYSFPLSLNCDRDRDFDRALDHVRARALSRALDFSRALALDRTLDHTLDRALTLDSDRVRDLARCVGALALARDRAHARARDLARRMVARDRDLNSALERALALEVEGDHDFACALARDFAHILAHDLARDRARDLDLDLDLDLALDLDHDLNRSLDLDHVSSRDFKIEDILSRILDLEVDRVRDLKVDFALDLALDHDLNRALTLDRVTFRDFALSLDLALSLILDLSLVLARDFALSFDLVLSLSLDLSVYLDLLLSLDFLLTPDFISCLRQLKEELPPSTCSNEIQHWWSLHGLRWIEQLRQVMIEHRNIGHDWKFTQEKKQQLRRYYESNKFLVDLMKIEGAISKDCRTEIEDGLLLPWVELQRRLPHLYGELKE